MKFTSKIGGALLAISFALSTNAQLETPQPSPMCSIEQTVGLTQVKVEYSRPSAKGRKIFGDLVAYDQMWRTGANASTKIEIDNNIKIEGNELPAGKYALYSIPGKESWTIILHKNTSYWGVGEYKESEDVFRFKVTPQTIEMPVESFTIDFGSFSSDGAMMHLVWENTKVEFALSTNSNEMVEKQIKNLLIDGPDAGTYYSAARFYYDNNKDLNRALEWMDIAISKRSNAFWYIHQKAKIQAKLGMKKEAIKTAEMSLKMAQENEAGDYGYIKNNQDLIESLKAGK